MIRVYDEAGNMISPTPDRKSEQEAVKAGQTVWGKAGAHLPENVGKGPIDVILVELKSKPAKKESF